MGLRRKDGKFGAEPPIANEHGIKIEWLKGHNKHWGLPGGNRFRFGNEELYGGGIKWESDANFDYDAGNEWYPETGNTRHPGTGVKELQRVKGSDNPLGLFASLLRLLSYLVSNSL